MNEPVDGMQVSELYDAEVAYVAFFYEHRSWSESYLELSS
jgi:hypothetical protein